VNKHWTMLVMYFILLKLSKTYRFRENFVDIRTELFFLQWKICTYWMFLVFKLGGLHYTRPGISNAKDIAGCKRGHKDFQVGPLVNIFSSMNVNILLHTLPIVNCR